MQRKKGNKVLSLLLTFILISGCFTSQIRGLLVLPAQQKISVGDQLTLKESFPEKLLSSLSVDLQSTTAGIFSMNGKSVAQSWDLSTGRPVAARPGTASMQLKLFGIIPVKNMVVNVVPGLRLVPGGHSIGVMLNAQGVMVVGHSQVVDQAGNKHFPARSAGIQLGDVVTKINGQRVNNDQDMAEVIRTYGGSNQKLAIEFLRKGRKMQTKVQPILCKETKSYRIGLFIRDSAAGVGTLTFYDPQTGKYGALGHIITDADTGQKIDIRDGKVVKAAIQGIQLGKKGNPGEKIGMFVDDKTISGNIFKNTYVGIFGQIFTQMKNPYHSQALPVGLSSQAETGPAEIYTVVEGTKIERFTINIERLLAFDRPDAKGMVIEVTDKRLLAKTGGIIQGMSGSPIVQKGKIIGAVTHVFVNNPAKGYGVYIERMLFEAGILPVKDKQKAS